MFFASQNGYVEIVNALLAQNADVNAANNSGTTALSMASHNGHLSVVQALLAHPNIEVNKAYTVTGATPLFLASRKGHAAVIKALLAQKAEIDKTNNNGYSIANCASKGPPRNIHALLQAGANQDISNNGDYQFGYKVIISDGKIRIEVAKDASSCLSSCLKPIDSATEIYTHLETLLKGIPEADPHLQTYKNKLNDYAQIIRLAQQALSKKNVRNADDADLKSPSPKRAAGGSD